MKLRWKPSEFANLPNREKALVTVMIDHYMKTAV
jgi:hypothetical protein